jgi:hypothetical protein
MINAIGNIVGSNNSVAAGYAAYDVIVIIGDSKTGTSPSAGTEPTAGTVYEWNDSLGIVQQVGASDLTGVASVGSPWPRCGINYNAATGRKPVFVYCGTSGSRFSIHPTNLSWRTSGSLYGPMKTKVNNCLTALGKTAPTAIFVILGINDITATEALSTIETDVVSLYQRLSDDFSSCPIVTAIPGKNTTMTNNARALSVRTYIMDQCYSRSNLSPLYFETSFNEAGSMYSDNLHFSAAGNDWVGVFYAQWLKNSTYSKFGRSMISTMFTDLTNTRKSLLDTCVAAEASNGNLAKYEYFYWFKNGDSKDMWIDYAGHYVGDNLSFSFSANSHVATTGTARFNSGIVGASVFSKVSLNNRFEGAKIRTRVSSGTANATVFGVSNAGGDTVILAQTSTPSLIYAVNDQTLTAVTSPDASLQNDTFYAVLRSSSGSKSLIKNNAIVDTASVTSTAEPTGANLQQYLSVKNQNTSIVNALSAQYEFYICATGDIDYAAFYNNWENVVNNW